MSKKIQFRFLRWFCKPGLYEQVAGDIEESYRRKLEEKGRFRAGLFLWIQVIAFIRPFSMKNPFPNVLLLRNYSLVAIRNIRRKKLFSFINIFGLAMSMLAGIIVIAIVVDQKSFDRFHENRNDIYRITTKSYYMNFDPHRLATTTLALTDELSTRHIDQLVRIRRPFRTDASTPDKTVNLMGMFVDQNFLEVFSFEMVSGNTANALWEPYSIILTRKAATRLYGDQSPVGQVVELKGLGSLTVTGIMEDVPRRSHLQFEALLSFSTIPPLEDQGLARQTLGNWTDYTTNYIYFVKNPGSSVEDVELELNRIGEKAYADYEELDAEFIVQPLNNIALGADLINQIGPTTEIAIIYVFSIFVLVILLAAAFNYSNLSIAQSLKRSKEIGIRKVQGGSRGSIFGMFIMESVILSLLALVVAMLIFQAVKPSLDGNLSNQYLSLELTWQMVVGFVGFAIFTGLVAGMVPSAILSRIRITSVLQQSSSLKLLKGLSARKVLIVVQFTLSMVFVMIAITGFRQYRFSINYDTGFRKENIVNVDLQGNDPEVFRAKFEQLPEVEEISFSRFVMARGTRNNEWVKMKDPQDSILVNSIHVDAGFISVHDLEIIAGRNFNPITPETQAVINEKMLGMLGFDEPADVLGEKMTTGNGEQITVVGVIRDFHYEKISREMLGFYLVHEPVGQYGIANVLVNNNDWLSLFEKLDRQWNEVDGGVHQFSAELFTDQLKASYEDLVVMVKMVGSLAAVVITISGLGLLGMVVYIVETRIREIGIRKTLGATQANLMQMLSKGFLIIVVISGLVASLLSSLIIYQVLLPQMATTIDVGVWQFLLGFMVLLIPSILFILPAVYRAAQTNPALTLKSE